MQNFKFVVAKTDTRQVPYKNKDGKEVKSTIHEVSGNLVNDYGFVLYCKIRHFEPLEKGTYPVNFEMKGDDFNNLVIKPRIIA